MRALMPTNYDMLVGSEGGEGEESGRTYLLEEHEAHAHVSSSPASFLEAVCPGGHFQQEGLPSPPSLESRMLFCVQFLVEANLGLDVEVLLTDPLVGWRQPTQLGQALEGFFVASLGCEPSRGERQGKDTASEDKSGNHLQEEREPPGPFACHESSAICDPVCDDDSKDNTKLFQHQ